MSEQFSRELWDNPAFHEGRKWGRMERDATRDTPLTQEQIVLRTKEREFYRTMGMLKANNGTGAMTPAMWLLLEDAYYGQGLQCDWPKWKAYLTSLEKEDADDGE